MSDRVDITLGEPDGPPPDKPDLLEQIVGELKDVGSTAKGAGKKYVNAKADQESVRVKQMEAAIFAESGKLELARQEQIADREKQQKELELEEKRDKNAHRERMRELKLQEQQNKIAAFNAVTDRLMALKALEVKVDFKVSDLDEVTKRLLDAK